MIVPHTEFACGGELDFFFGMTHLKLEISNTSVS